MGVDVKGFELLASGYGAIEGPVADEAGGLYFSDVPGGGVFRLGPDGQVDTVIPRRKSVGGICLHADGGIVVSGRDVSRVFNGHSEVLLSTADLPDGDSRVSGFNDLGADQTGRIFVGAVRRRRQDDEMENCELVMIADRGKGEPVYGGIGLPNGVVASPDGRYLYHADTLAKSITVVDLTDAAPVPAVSRRISTAEIPGGPDGMAADEHGGLWAAFYQGGCIVRFTPEGQVDRRIEVPAANPLNLCFVGADLENLVVVTMDNNDEAGLGASIFLTEVGVRGARVDRATV
jgi:gluconolactonase